MKKRILAVIAAVCIAALALAACGGGNSGGGNSGGGGKAETYEVGSFTVAVPSGWTVYQQTDMFGEKDAEGNYPIDPDQIFLAKGASGEFDAYSKPNIRIYWYDPNTTVLDMKSIYDDLEELSGVTINGVECEAYAGTSIGYRYDFIHYQTDDMQFECQILVSVDGEETGVTWEDPDIQTILESIKAQ